MIDTIPIRFGVNKIEKISIKTSVFSLNAIILAAYSIQDKVIVTLDGNPNDEIDIFFNKNGYVDEFNNQLIIYSDYLKNADHNNPLREALIEKSLFGNQELAVPWEEKYGKDM